jgi:hypothetical protein
MNQLIKPSKFDLSLTIMVSMFVPPMRAEDLLKIVLNDLLYPYGLFFQRVFRIIIAVIF